MIMHASCTVVSTGDGIAHQAYFPPCAVYILTIWLLFFKTSQ